ncbi:MAG: hypothetical protein AAF826_11610 [Pseudomonadota bacterium]
MKNTDYTEHYSEIHRETHRRVYPWLAGPLLARHITLLPSQDLAPRTKKDPRTSKLTLRAFEAMMSSFDPLRADQPDGKHAWQFERSNWAQQTADLPMHVLLKKPYIARAVPYGFSNGEARKLAGSEIAKVQKDGEFDAYVRILQRADVFGEYFTITQILELPLNPDFASRMGLLENRRDISDLYRYLGHLGQDPKERKKFPTEVDHPTPACENYSKLLFEDFWSKIDKAMEASAEIPAPSGAGRSNQTLLGRAQESRVKDSLFARHGFKAQGDFRMVLPHHPRIVATDDKSEKSDILFPRVDQDSIAFPIRFTDDGRPNAEGERRPQLENPSEFAGASPDTKHKLDDNEVRKLLKQHFNLWSDQDHRDGKKEIVASTFMNQRALYVSSVGFEAVNEDLEKSPLNLLLVSHLSDPWELSRLVFRLFMLGTLRLMAVRQMPKLYIAGSELDALEAEVLAHVERTENENLVTRTLKYPLRLIADPVKLMRINFAHIQGYGVSATKLLWPQRLWERLNLTKGPIIKRASFGREDLVGGLRFRIQRSSYYSSSYKSRIDDLNEDKILGYQSYAELMRRRLFASFNYVASLEGKLLSVDRLLERIGQRSRLNQAAFLNFILVVIAILSVPGSFMLLRDKYEFVSSLERVMVEFVKGLGPF